MNRSVPLAEVTEGMILGRPVTDAAGRMLMNAGVSLTQALIDRIKTTGLPSVWIDDPNYVEADNSQANEAVVREAQDKKFSDVKSNPTMEMLWKYSTEYLVKKGGGA